MRQLNHLSVLFLLAATPAAADVVVEGVEVARAGGARQEEPRTVRISPRGIRMDQGHQSHVVDARNRVLLELDHDKKTARRMTFAELGAMSARARRDADDAVAKARNQLPAMPPELRAEVEAALAAQRSAQAARAPGAYERRPTGNARVVNGFKCEDVKELLNGDWVGTSCVHRGVTLPKADREMLTRLAEEMGKLGMAGAAQGEMGRAFLDGIPVELATRDPHSGQLSVEERVTRIRLEAVAETAFDVPAGYRVLTWEDAGPVRPRR